MTHTPRLTYIDKAGPHMLIRQECIECNIVVSTHEIDVSDLPLDFEAGNLGAIDGQAWLKHEEGK